MAGFAKKEMLFTFDLEQPDLPTFQVVHFEGEEAVSTLFRFEITLVSDTANADLDSVLNSPATLRIWTRDHSRSAPYKGMLAEFEQLGQVDNYYFYRAVLVPRLWRLNLTHLTDVYTQEQRSTEAILAILSRNNLKGSDVQLTLKNSDHYRLRSFICQYQETDLAFISRWMEFEGLYYFFDHDQPQANGEVLNIIDFKEAQPEASLTLRYTPPENVQTGLQDSSVTAFTCRKTHVPGNVVVQDFNFRKASLGDDLKSSQSVTQGRSGTYLYYGGNLRSELEAARLAQVRAEELATQGSVFKGDAYAVGVRSGQFIDITHHFRADYNAKYWVTRVRHKGTQTGVILAGQTTQHNDGESGSLYQCSFEALPAQQQFRAQCLTPKPVISGVLNAIVDAKGESPHAEMNAFGQYKVQFMFDYSERSAAEGSTWLRMLTPYAGKSIGMQFPLLKGTEVLVGFVGGDPDQPIIVGAASNSETPNIIGSVNPSCNGIRTQSGNVMNLVDKPGKECIAMYSPKQESGIYIGAFPVFDSDVTVPRIDSVKILDQAG